MGARAVAGFLALALLAGSTPAGAGTVAGCDDTALQGPALTGCLTEAEKRSGAGLAAEVERALASIGTRKGVFDTQRNRWRNSLTISHAAWLRFRNDECQNVAPFEGQTGSTSALRNRVAAFEAKLVCTIEMNTARAADLARRYPAD